MRVRAIFKIERNYKNKFKRIRLIEIIYSKQKKSVSIGIDKTSFSRRYSDGYMGWFFNFSFIRVHFKKAGGGLFPY